MFINMVVDLLQLAKCKRVAPTQKTINSTAGGLPEFFSTSSIQIVQV